MALEPLRLLALWGNWCMKTKAQPFMGEPLALLPKSSMIPLLESSGEPCPTSKGGWCLFASKKLFFKKIEKRC